MNKLNKIIIIILCFSFIFTQNTKDKKTNNKIVFSNTESKQDYIKVLEKSINLLETNYVERIINYVTV